MTYQDLLNQLQGLNAEQLKQDVTVYAQGLDEYYGLVSDYPFTYSETDDVLDMGHPYLVI